jgi:hypothetical protein
MEFQTIEPKILYFGTPVALVSSLNEDGKTNLAPMSPFWALGWTLVLGLVDETQTAGDYIDPGKWSPLIYNFRHYYRLADRELGKTFRAER